MTVSTNSSYSVTINAEGYGDTAWLTYTKSGSTLKLSVRKNYGIAARTGSVTVTAGGVSKNIVVTQSAGAAAPTLALRIGESYYSDGDSYGPLKGGDTIYMSADYTNAQRLYIRVYNANTGGTVISSGNFDSSVSGSTVDYYPVLKTGLSAGTYIVEGTVTNSDVRNDPWSQKAVVTFALQVISTSGDAYPNTWKNTGNYAKDLVGVASTQSGYIGSNTINNMTGKLTSTQTHGDYTKYAYEMGLSNPDHWCASFVSWCAAQAGIPDTVISSSAGASPGLLCPKAKKEKGHTYYFELNAAMKKNHSYLSTYGTQTTRSTFVPQTGDLIFFRWEPSDSTYSFSHVGIVTSVSGGKVYYIDGNGNGDRVPNLGEKSYSLTSNEIQCYARPW